MRRFAMQTGQTAAEYLGVLLIVSVVIAAAQRVRAPESWIHPLGTLLAAGALGLLVGLGVPWIGTAAGVGVVLYFICAVAAHLRVRDPQIGAAAAFLVLAIAALALSLAHRGLS